MLDLKAIRGDFPYLDACIYLNTAGAGLSFAAQGEAAAEFYGSDKAKGMGGADAWAAKSAAAKSALGELLGVAPRALHFLSSTTEALNLVAMSLPLRRGDKVVVAQDEFPSVIQAWLGRQQQGIELVHVPIPDEARRTEALCTAVGAGVRALAVSHIHWRTGTRVDLDALSARCRERDCRLIVDGVQAIGAVPVKAELADAYCGSVFKWLLSGFGLAFLSLGERLASELEPAMRGYRNESPSRSIDYSHVNYPGVYALLASLRYLDSLGWPAIHARVDQLAGRTAAALRRHGYHVITPDAARGGIVSLQHPAASSLVRALADQSIYVEDRDRVVRASPHFYNTEEDIDRFASALARISERDRLPA